MLTSPGAVILLVTSPRVAAGQLTWPAWQALRTAGRVLCGDGGHPQLPALAASGIRCELVSSDHGPLAPAPAADERLGPVPAADERTAWLAATLADAAGSCPAPVVWLAGPGGPLSAAVPGWSVPTSDTGEQEAAALAAALRALPDGPEVAVVTGSSDLPGAHLIDLVTVMATLRTGCPWDAQQTHRSLAPHLLEEPYEALAALEDDDFASLREELGDVALQVVFHAAIAAERRDATGFTIDDVADGIVAKLVRRHPHVFGQVTVSGADEVKRNWDEIKKAEKAERAPVDAPAASVLDGVPFGQPALALAAQLQRRAARAGAPVDLFCGGQSLGDSLLRIVATSREAGLDPELELRAAARAFRDRVTAWERAAREQRTG